MDHLWSYNTPTKSDSDTRLPTGTISGTDLMSGWLSRPPSVLMDDQDMYHLSPREQGDLRPLRSGKSNRLPPDLRGVRD